MGRHHAAVVGVGQSRLLRFDDVPLGVLAVEATQAALADAGLATGDLDGIACIPRQPFDDEGSQRDGEHFVSTHLLLRLLSIESTRWGANVDIMLGHSLIEAVNAVEAGACSHALVFRALHSPRGGYGRVTSLEVSGERQFTAPYGRFPPADFAQLWSRYQDVYSAGSRDQMAALVLQSRVNGLRTPGGYWTVRGGATPTREEYLSTRMVSTPLGLLDCDLPVQGCTAFVVTTGDRAQDLRQPPAYVLGTAAPYFAEHGSVVPRGHTLDHHERCGEIIAEHVWHDSGLRPGDVSAANLYDGFSFIPILWLEALGFCARGEGFDFIQDGRIAPTGALPVNTGGGNLGVGRLHGANQIAESVLQVSGRAGERQLDRAEAVIATVGPPARGAAIVFGSSPG